MPVTLFYSPDILINPQLTENESQHCAKVLRMQIGEELIVTDGNGSFYNCILVDNHPKHCTVSIHNRLEIKRSRDFYLQIAFAPTKQLDRNEWFVEKATEIGIDRFTPFISTYSERKEIKNERLQKIAISAMKQSRQAYLPLIDKYIQFDKFITLPFNGRKFIAHCYDLPKKPLIQTYKKGDNSLILIGPEGDFSEEEVTKAIKSGFEPVSLGNTRLRTETACFVAAHSIHVINNS